MLHVLTIGLSLASVAFSATNCTFRLANTLGNHMVLQQSPARAKIWGFAKQGTNVTVSIKSAMQTVTAGSNCIWEAYLPAEKASMNPTTIFVFVTNDKNTNATLSDVLFGDVWLCGGQSNMQFALNQVINASAEIAAAKNYPHIRLFTSALITSTTPVEELKGIEQPWSVASPKTVSNGKAFSLFSAMCWLFGRSLFDDLKYPIGLIASNWGGTPVRAWSSPSVTTACNVKSSSIELQNKMPSQWQFGGPQDDNVLWNSMIVPFLRTSIYGAIWYQGEADSRTGYSYKYACTFTKMIEDWRRQFSQKSATSNDFPFGFVHLEPWNDQHAEANCLDSVPCLLVPTVRFGSTNNFSYAPNPTMSNVFMATAIDYGDPTSPYGDVHPRYKQPVAKRLFEAAQVVAYKKRGVYSTGPWATSFSVKDANTLEVVFANVGVSLAMKNTADVEVMVGGHWIAAEWSGANGKTATIAVKNGGASNVSQIRYAWKQAPCLPTKGVMNCALYSGTYPVLPFLLKK